VFIPRLPRNLTEMRDGIMAAVSTINSDILQRVWDELDYRIDVCCVTRVAHIEHLYV
jgi:hypothetical protein